MEKEVQMNMEHLQNTNNDMKQDKEDYWLYALLFLGAAFILFSI
ncbi:hypothetical protein M2459_002634 [Parabacteroides sp. PF5-5]|nr:hypothetical protein [Parabacteroides sp. PH5-39]MDH6316938.1 hypothetical protein [Parabacteroides sp. PF5-13]MDH6321007.1 hypothetical protein [Parabacteroides sp. PH5-13]MDH6324739.1 hypothetical protein [Parabacteroides sp. PH5-8]MDH6328123.1 hypothetical protein [Parabacteroides sp. PH5-41]MDH6335869.1 hypothetical protein [Parabacteroides sp. PF5-5]MDH6346989.1 hypothetical protein [Parabacteroides sp. PH5-46]MDH6361951.1 hypothetical protein [Parabacteroides sp. PH5-16]MDH6377619.